MEDIEAPRKKRKIEVGVTPSTENHMTNGDSSVATSVASPSRAQSHLQFNPSMFQRLRQITKVCQKNFLPTPKPNGSKLPLGTENAREPDSRGINASTTAAADSSDFIISSAGSSPAHSPQPLDFEVLSTPPRPSKPKEDFEVLATPTRPSKPKEDFEVLATPPRTSKSKEGETNRTVTTETAQSKTDDRQKACSRLVERFEESSSSKRTLSNGVLADSKTIDQESSSIEVLEEGDQTPSVDSTAKTVHAVNGEVSSPAARKDLDISSSKEQNSPALSDLAPSVTAEDSRGFNFNSDDFRKILKKMIEERMAQLERSMGSESEDRLASLEKENKTLKEYAKKLEDSVKSLLTAEKEKARQRVTRAVQTQDPHWLTNLRPKTVTTAPPQSGVTVTHPSCMGLTLTTTPTPRLTSTVAPLPGHTVPSRLDNAPVNYRSAVQRPQAEPLRPRISASSNMSPRPQPSGVVYVPNYDPGPAGRSVAGQPTGLRAPASAPNFSTSGQPRFNAVRAPGPTAQPPRPVLRMPGPVVSPGGPRSIAPTPTSRPLPTVTVHPQTQTPSSATSVRVQQEPPAYGGYPAQNVYNGGQHGTRFAVAPQVRPQRPQHPQVGPPQISHGPRTPAYPQSPIQASPSQRIMQQPMHPEQQTAPLPRSSVQIRASPPMQIRASPPMQIRASPPVQMQSSPRAINQHRPPQPQQPGMVHYQQVPGPPRQVTPAQPQPNYGAVAVRPPPPPPAGVAQQPPPIPWASPKEPPPKPSVSIAVVTSGIVLSWNMVLEERHAPVTNYQLFALQDGGTVENAHQWKKIGVVKALPLPMACTLTQFSPGNKYHFAVRGMDEAGRLGPFSDPCTITLK